MTNPSVQPDVALQSARQRSVDNLQRLYTVVVSLAVTEHLKRLLAASLGTSPYTPTTTPSDASNSWFPYLMFFSLVCTLIPFYHGANRYLDATYVTHERHARPGALMFDFVVLFIQGLLFYLVAMLSIHFEYFYTGLAGLLLFDAAWVGLTRLYTDHRGGPGYKVWAGINLAAAFALLICVWMDSPFLRWRNEIVRNVLPALIVLVRTVYDYKSVWPFYYPGAGGMIPAPRPAPIPQVGGTP